MNMPTNPYDQARVLERQQETIARLSEELGALFDRVTILETVLYGGADAPEDWASPSEGTAADAPNPVVPAAGDGDDDAFDPTEHNVADVLARLNELAKEPTDENKAEIERILAAERAGEHRKTIVGERPAAS